MQNLKLIGSKLATAFTGLRGLTKAALAGAASAAVLAGNIAGTVRGRAQDITAAATGNRTREGEIIMKKSTVVALFVALAAVVGVLAALYLYVLRREKELDEYEQLLFGEDYGFDTEPETVEEAPVEDAKPAKAEK